MALRWFDGYDWVSGNNVDATKYGNYDFGGFSTITGRHSTSAAQTANTYLGKTFDNQGTWIFGMALQTNNLPGSGSQPIWLELFDGTTRQLVVAHYGGSLLVGRGGTAATANATTLATGPTLMQNRWYHLACKFVISNAGGRAIIRINNQTVIDYTGDTQESANAFANSIRWGGISDGNGTSFDDVYIFDGTGSSNNDLPADADLRVRGLSPTGNGTYSEWDGSDGNSTDNYLLIDEVGASTPTDTDYVSTSIVGERDTYAHADMPTNSTVYGVAHKIILRKDDAGSHTARSLVRVGSTDYEGSSVSVLDAYQGYDRIMETNPNTSAQWTPTEVNTIDSGVKLQS